jgi:hypothetical protein
MKAVVGGGTMLKRIEVRQSPSEATAFVHKQQQTWQPVLDAIAKNQR